MSDEQAGSKTFQAPSPTSGSGFAAWLGRAAFESALIVFAVVLGFAVNNWREDARAQERAADALARIRTEVETNRRIVAGVIDYHREIRTALNALLDAPPADTPPFETLFSVADQGIGDLILQDAAWTTALQQDALARADFELVQDIAMVYSLADSGAYASWRAIIGQLGELRMHEPDPEGVALRRFALSFQNLEAQERGLAGVYDRLLARLEPYRAADDE